MMILFNDIQYMMIMIMMNRMVVLQEIPESTRPVVHCYQLEDQRFQFFSSGRSSCCDSVLLEICGYFLGFLVMSIYAQLMIDDLDLLFLPFLPFLLFLLSFNFQRHKTL